MDTRRRNWIDGFCVVANALSIPPGEYGRKTKLKGIDGTPHKRRSMRLNSMIPVEPYLDLTYREKLEKSSVRKRPIQVVHGCRQLVS